MSEASFARSCRSALKCLAYGSAGTLFTIAGGVLAPIDLASTAPESGLGAAAGKPRLLQISDTHVGFSKEANPDVAATLQQTIDLVNAMPEQPALAIHTRRHHALVEAGGVRPCAADACPAAHRRDAHGARRARHARPERGRIL